ncbi:MAG: Nucleotidyltransferase domain protein [candidate division TM6 bacterium GW2011_GWF2_37_49]|nr:MAG: Nucleotidyltransferase domain protein [candidate division TM6 bacterium GW2011_GWF2_37_49]
MISNEIIKSVTQQLVAAYNPVAIYLFGSYAWGKPDAGSDLDLLIVVDKSDKKPHLRSDAGSEALWHLKVPKDLLIYTKDEFAQRVGDVTTLCHKIKKEGRVLYARA